VFLGRILLDYNLKIDHNSENDHVVGIDGSVMFENWPAFLTLFRRETAQMPADARHETEGTGFCRCQGVWGKYFPMPLG
jgi:hypothetical protein